jgi:uncharacterized LabA/DUF88 family protein
MRVIFLIDGFNLYHSISDAQKDSGLGSKWLDIRSLMSAYLEHLSPKASIEEIFFFTAIRTHVQKFNPQTVQRHKDYLKILKNTGIQVIEGKFKKGKSYCKTCKKEGEKYEEKETDVNIAVKLVELAFMDQADIFVIVSGDTDLIPGVDVVRRQFPHKKVFVIFPYKRKNTDILSRVDGNFKMKADTYARHQFDDPYTIDKKSFTKPKHW